MVGGWVRLGISAYGTFRGRRLGISGDSNFSGRRLGKAIHLSR